jgi:hypothetical protein
MCSTNCPSGSSRTSARSCGRSLRHRVVTSPTAAGMAGAPGRATGTGRRSGPQHQSISSEEPDGSSARRFSETATLTSETATLTSETATLTSETSGPLVIRVHDHPAGAPAARPPFMQLSVTTKRHVDRHAQPQKRHASVMWVSQSRNACQVTHQQADSGRRPARL